MAFTLGIVKQPLQHCTVVLVAEPRSYWLWMGEQGMVNQSKCLRQHNRQRICLQALKKTSWTRERTPENFCFCSFPGSNFIHPGMLLWCFYFGLWSICNRLQYGTWPRRRGCHRVHILTWQGQRASILSQLLLIRASAILSECWKLVYKMLMLTVSQKKVLPLHPRWSLLVNQQSRDSLAHSNVSKRAKSLPSSCFWW